MNKKPLQIAIDGPVGVGKGTLTVALTKQLNIPSIYTGGMYRALALDCLRKKIHIHNEKEVFKTFQKSSIELKLTKFGTRVFLNGEEVSNEIFLPEISRIVHIIASFPSVRKEMVLRQQKLIKGKSAIIEGRDIATDVAPNADLKIYLTASVEVRAKRRFKQFKEKGVKITFEEVLSDLQERDKRDTERQASPLTIVPDAYVLDTTDLTIKETVDKVLEILKKKELI